MNFSPGAKFIMVPDYHIHTPLCRHAEGNPAEFKTQARRLGIPEIAFTDHVPNPDGYDPRCRMSMEEWPTYRNLILDQQTVEPPQVLFGVEADYYEGCERFLRPSLSNQPLDLVIGSIHYLGTWGFDNPEERQVWDTVDVTGAWQKYFELLGRFAESRLIDVIGHLDLPKKFGYRPPEHAIRDMAHPALDRIAQAGLAIEINTSGLRKPVREIYPSAMLLALARERDIPICFGSDAHKPEEVGDRFEESLKLAREAGYTQAVRFSAHQKTVYPLP
ncbi:MAG: histidinol-phosphatase HisJ family protein [Verrucomicrobia bacterium]|nr:histidinol-phosphatase HisJ family protein [Verrucomicrobiota bacterium]MCG2681821.1 histidinol-phosphatase HisJ family protein [Kiritimatiellia bacterium]MBU4247703.1 histidinol-phosphatase HisJ family protein [Verrucomicrobiota bacterium]MBU4291646.1 histidinol-phosphatase HisJ family protein [Verrucomicrobiota bacterium]MBU4429537.1 histidinol-phosphatase HisJ family protein [Verrucomicrobiota bacterium]